MIGAKEQDIYYQAMLSRDARFDGRFFAGVTTTGIYCRPICPAPKPKLENVVFYLSSAGAESHGFRPCKRCRPDASPGTPDWIGPSAIVSRALTLINNGYLDSNSVQQLGETLGRGERQLRRLFKKHLGASPLAVAITRRLDFARKLIDETNISMTDVAFTSGFESIRRFNDALKKRFGETPTELRKTARNNRTGNGHKNRITLHLPYRPPMDWSALLSYLKARQIPGVEKIDKNRYSRSIQLAKTSGVILVTPSSRDCHLALTLQIHSPTELMTMVRRVCRIFDLGADPMFITNHLQKDPGLFSIVSAFPGLRVPGGWDNFEIAVRTIVGQQVSIQAANTITGRLVREYGTPMENSFIPGIAYLFPTPDVLAAADLGAIGMPAKRARTLNILASKVAKGEIILEGTADIESIKGDLLKLPGIGKWTTEYIAMRALREPDAFPAGDLALKRELQGMSNQAEDDYRGINRPQVWRPWRAYAAMYLWKKHANKNVKNQEVRL
jgi:AraC family transcriptional regulator of adaptative response / DNA-3-methyladenine glycosylase II